MSERDQYPAGVPCWVDTSQPDPEAAHRFYAEVFGWEFVPGPGAYALARVGGRDVAGIGALPTGAERGAAWHTYIAVDDLEAAVARAADAGATVIEAAIDAAPAGRLAVLADPSGATFCLWEAGTRQGAQRINESGAWAMSQLVTDDPERCIAFYTAAFGWTTERFGAFTMFRLPGYEGGEPEQPVSREVVATTAPQGEENLPPVWNVDFWVDDVDAAAERAVALGGTVLTGPYDTPVSRMVVLADPAGASFSVSKITA